MLRRRPVLMTNITAVLVGFSMFASFLLIPQLAQTPEHVGYGFGASVTGAGLLMLPSTLVMLVAGPWAGRIATRSSSRLPLVIGTFFGMLAFIFYALFHDTEWQICVGGALLGIGIGFSFASMANLVVESVPRDEVGVATGINTIMRSLGGALGAQLVASLLVGQDDRRHGGPGRGGLHGRVHRRRGRRRPGDARRAGDPADAPPAGAGRQHRSRRCLGSASVGGDAPHRRPRLPRAPRRLRRRVRAQQQHHREAAADRLRRRLAEDRDHRLRGRFDAATVRSSFAGSDELAAQIRQGVKPDVFASANTKLPDQLYDEGLVEKPVVFAANELVLAVPADGTVDEPRRPHQARARRSRWARSPCPSAPTRARCSTGCPTTSARRSWPTCAPTSPTSRGVVGKVAQGAVDAGFVYRTDVEAAGDKLKAIDLPADLKPQVAYGVAVVKGAKHPEQAQGVRRRAAERSGPRRARPRRLPAACLET